jgi:hypothetical protein
MKITKQELVVIREGLEICRTRAGQTLEALERHGYGGSNPLAHINNIAFYRQRIDTMNALLKKV